MSQWVTTYTREDGKVIQKKFMGEAWASVWEEGFNSRGDTHWAVYIGDGNNQIHSGNTRTFVGSKIAASFALKRIRGS